MKTNFHISLPCRNIDETKSFYTDVLGATRGRSSINWVDIDLYGHQMTFTLGKKFNFDYPHYNFEGHVLPAFHFGVILDEKPWMALQHKLTDQKIKSIDKGTFLLNKSGEHKSFFVKDPNDYTIEFKCFKNPKEVFKS